MINKLWVKLAVTIGVLTVVGVVSLVAGDIIDDYRGWVALCLGVAGLGSILATRRALEPLSHVTRVLEGIADGDLSQPRVPDARDDEIGSLASSTNRMLSQLSALSQKARALAEGKIGVLEVEEKVMRSQRLADADQSVSVGAGDLDRSFVALTNQLRRLTIQARMISNDQLDSRLLDERVPGELGEAFGMMVQNLRTIAERAKDIADGDLTTTVEGDGELTTAFNQMVAGLKGLVEEITHTAIHISTAAEQILAVLREQEFAANHQASSVEETQRTMETLLASAKKIAENAQGVFKSAEQTQDNNRTIAKRITELKSHTERIAEILEVIKSIADRSDLLALNASLEGMRAGEAGKGFTLVAAEMRRLAENIKGSVGNIKELVEDIGESSMSSAMATDEGTRLSEKTTENALKITLITQQQKSGTEQVTQSMDDLSELINQDVAGTQQVTMAASELVDLAENLRNLVDEFRISQNPATSGEYKAAKRRRKKSGAGYRPSSSSQSMEMPTGLAASSSPSVDQPGEYTPRRSGADESTNLRESSQSQAVRASRKTAKLSPLDSQVEESKLDESSSIPIDSGADQPTIEFASSMPEDDQREAMREMLARREAKKDDDEDTGEVAGLADVDKVDDLGGLEDFAFDEDLDSEPEEASDASSIDEQIDALERELDDSSDDDASDDDSIISSLDEEKS